MTDTSDLGPPPDELRDLLAGERDVSAAERAAIRHELGTSIGAPAAATTSLVASKALWLIAGALVAAGIWWYASRGPSRPAEPPAIAPPTATERIEDHAVAQAPEPAPPPAPPLSAPAPRSAPTEAPSQADLLARAWQVLARHDADAALKLLDDDRRLHPDGALAEERDAMHVQALAAAGRLTEARSEAAAFLARYPRSVHRAAVEKAVAP